MDKALLAISVAFTVTVMLSACAVTPPPDVAVGIPCNAGPIILDQDDHLTTETLRQIVTINRAGAKLCDWQKPKPKGTDQWTLNRQ